jgi:hypothetical protein
MPDSTAVTDPTPDTHPTSVALPDGRTVAFPASMSSDDVDKAAADLHTSAAPAPLAKPTTPDPGSMSKQAQAVLSGKAPGKYDIKPYDSATQKFDMMTSDDAGNPLPLKPQHEAMVRDMMNKMSPEQTPVGGMVFVPEGKYNQIKDQISHGYLFGKKISTGNEENFQMGGDVLGDGFSLPQYRKTFMNAALLNNPQKLQQVLAHELGHNAAWLADRKHPDLSEAGADSFKDAYLKRAKDTTKNWAAITNLPAQVPKASNFQAVLQGAPPSTEVASN